MHVESAEEHCRGEWYLCPRSGGPQPLGRSGQLDTHPGAKSGAIVLAQQDCVDTWSTDKIETFASAAEQMIVVRSVGKPHWKVFRTMSTIANTGGSAPQTRRPHRLRC